MKFPFLASFLVFSALLTYELRKSRRNEEKSMKNFLEKENAANSVRKKDLGGLPYISIPLENFPMDVLSDREDIIEIHEQLKTLSTKKIVNLTGISNTDLKLTYGTANITVLTEYDQNYTILARTIYKWGKLLYEANFISQAKQVLEFGIETGTDVSGNYKRLATIYKKEWNDEKIQELLDKASNLNSLMKNSIISSLKDIYHGEESANQ